MNRLPTIIEGTFELPTGKVTEVGTASWFNWLETPEAKSFRFEGERGTFTARKEMPKSGQSYWSAVRKVSGQLRKSYLGKSATLTLERMEEIAAKLAEPQPEKVGNSATRQATNTGNSVTTSVTLTLPQEVTQQLQNQVAELAMQLKQLQSELPSLIQSQIAAAIAPREEVSLGESHELTAARQQIAELTLKQVDTQATADRLQAELDEVQLKLASTRANVQEVNWLCNEARNDLWLTSEKLRLREEEVEALKSQLATVTETVTVQALPVCEEKPDFDALAAAALASLKLGKQAPGYKAAVKALAAFIKLLQGG